MGSSLSSSQGAAGPNLNTNTSSPSDHLLASSTGEMTAMNRSQPIETAVNYNDTSQHVLSPQSGAQANFSTQSNGTSPYNQHHDDDEFSVEIFGNVLYPFRWLTFTTLTSWLGPLSSVAMIVGCVMPYVPQYATIYKTRSCSGFSTFVCLTLLVANILRIAFWFGHRFELPLLIQSVIMVFAQVALLELCIRVKKGPTKRRLWSSHPKFFWRWTDLASYLEFMLLFTLLLGVAVYYFIECKLFIETIGYCALIGESMLGLPQVIKNFRKKSVEGMSLSMVLMWLAGDTFKTGYFIAKAVPFQFWLCGLLQISIDVIILLQVCLYRQNAPMKLSPRSQESPKEMVTL